MREAPWIRSSARGLQFDVGGHSGADFARRFIDANLHAEDLVNALFAGLHVARQKFRLLIDLLDDAVENVFREGVNADFRFLAELNVADLGFRNVDAHVDLIALEQAWRPECLAR